MSFLAKWAIDLRKLAKKQEVSVLLPTDLAQHFEKLLGKKGPVGHALTKHCDSISKKCIVSQDVLDQIPIRVGGYLKVFRGVSVGGNASEPRDFVELKVEPRATRSRVAKGEATLVPPDPNIGARKPRVRTATQAPIQEIAPPPTLGEQIQSEPAVALPAELAPFYEPPIVQNPIQSNPIQNPIQSNPNQNPVQSSPVQNPIQNPVQSSPVQNPVQSTKPRFIKQTRVSMSRAAYRKLVDHFLDRRPKRYTLSLDRDDVQESIHMGYKLPLSDRQRDNIKDAQRLKSPLDLELTPSQMAGWSPVFKGGLLEGAELDDGDQDGQAFLISNIELDRHLDGIPGYQGTYMMDALPDPPTQYPFCFIVNYDDSDEPGSHWVGVYLASGQAFYFDPFGAPPPKRLAKWLPPNTVWNTTSYQELGSSKCGYFTALWLACKSAGFDFDDLVRAGVLTAHPSDRNEDAMEALANLLRSHTGGSVVSDLLDKLSSKLHPWGKRKGWPSRVEKMLKQYGDQTITNITLGRTPVRSVYQKVLNWISLGHYDKAKSKTHDEVYHLFAVITLSNGVSLRMDRDEVVKLRPGTMPAEAQQHPVTLDKSITLLQLFDNTLEAYGGEIPRYNPVSGNCQQFLIKMLGSNDLIDTETRAFVEQNVGQLLNASSKAIIEGVTGLASEVQSARDSAVDQLGSLVSQIEDLLRP